MYTCMWVCMHACMYYVCIYGGPPEDEDFDPARHEGYSRFVGPGGIPSQEELSDEFSDGK
jgi:hypothetical protein